MKVGFDGGGSEHRILRWWVEGPLVSVRSAEAFEQSFREEGIAVNPWQLSQSIELGKPRHPHPTCGRDMRPFTVFGLIRSRTIGCLLYIGDHLFLGKPSYPGQPTALGQAMKRALSRVVFRGTVLRLDVRSGFYPSDADPMTRWIKQIEQPIEHRIIIKF